MPAGTACVATERLASQNCRFPPPCDIRQTRSTPQIEALDPDTVSDFQKLAGFDTLRMVLAQKLVLVEGPSHEILFERFFRDLYHKSPMQLGIDLMSTLDGRGRGSHLPNASIEGHGVCVFYADAITLNVRISTRQRSSHSKPFKAQVVQECLNREQDISASPSATASTPT